MAISTRPPGRYDRSRRDLSAPWRHVDAVLIACVLAIAAIGVLMVFSATRGPTDPPHTGFLVRQAAFAAMGAVVMMGVALVDYRRLLDWSWPAYVVTVLMLVTVLSPLGSKSKGAQAWFALGPFQLQPAEFAKIVTLMALAALLAAWRDEIDLRRLGIALGVAGLPMALIMVQPDLGMVLIFLFVVLGMLAASGLRGRYLLALVLIGVIGVVGVLNSNVLHQYQKNRLTAFIDPSNSASETTYNVHQAQIAVGGGGLTGRGLFNGEQTRGHFVPEQQTDFIFTVVAEEWGFLGAGGLLLLYGVVAFRVWRAAKLSRDRAGMLICVGVLSMLMFQIFENVGMCMGIMPVTGIPLPFLSYGGSSMITTFAALGLVLNVHMRRFR